MHFRPSPPHSESGFSLQELLVVMAIIGVATLIVLPAMTNLTAKAAEVSAKRNAQLLASVAAAAEAAGDPAFKALRSKPALIAYLTSGSYAPNGEIAKVGIEGLSANEAFEAARYLQFSSNRGGLAYSNAPVSAAADDQAGGGGGDEVSYEEESNRWNAQLLEGAANLAMANGDTIIQTAGNTETAITFLVDGGVGGPMVSGFSSDEQQGAAEYLDYAGGTLSYQAE